MNSPQLDTFIRSLKRLTTGFLLAVTFVFPIWKSTAQTFTTLHSFTGLTNSTNSDGASPWAALAVSGSTLYGTTVLGGIGEYGTVFSVGTSGTGFTTLYSFTNGYDGALPFGGVLLSGSTLYGTSIGYSYNYAGGTVFAISTNGTGFTTLHTFTGTGTDGLIPYAGLVLSGNTLFGTTYAGGTYGDGTVFSIKTDGSGFTTLYSFTDGTDGAGPYYGSLVVSGRTLYGTAGLGGDSAGDGTIFSIGTNGSGFTTLHIFNSPGDGVRPYAGLILGGSTLFGTTSLGGSAYGGTIFSINTNGTGYSILHSFDSTADGSEYPYAGLALSTSGLLYGTTTQGGPAGNGSVFAINTNGLAFVNMFGFPEVSGSAPYGSGPTAGLVLSVNSLYGTTVFGGASSEGTVFSLSSLSCETLTHWWKGESNALDSIGSDNGTTTSITYATGYSGLGFQFNGSSSYIHFPADAGNFGTNDFSIDFWMQTTNTSAQALLSKRAVCGYDNFWDIRVNSDGTINVGICQDTSGNYYRQLVSTATVRDGTFHEITFVRLNKALYLYVDGILNAATSTTHVININNSQVVSAGSDACVGQDGIIRFDGVLDEIKFAVPCY